MNNKIKNWKALKELLLEREKVEDLILGSNAPGASLDEMHWGGWKGTKSELLDYVREVKTHGANEVIVYTLGSKTFVPIWNNLEGFLF